MRFLGICDRGYSGVWKRLWRPYGLVNSYPLLPSLVCLMVIASVPLQKLDKFSKAPEKSRRWSFKDGWLVLEAF